MSSVTTSARRVITHAQIKDQRLDKNMLLPLKLGTYSFSSVTETPVKSITEESWNNLHVTDALQKSLLEIKTRFDGGESIEKLIASICCFGDEISPNLLKAAENRGVIHRTLTKSTQLLLAALYIFANPEKAFSPSDDVRYIPLGQKIFIGTCICLCCPCTIICCGPCFTAAKDEVLPDDPNYSNYPAPLKGTFNFANFKQFLANNISNKEIKEQITDKVSRSFLEENLSVKNNVVSFGPKIQNINYNLGNKQLAGKEGFVEIDNSLIVDSNSTHRLMQINDESFSFWKEKLTKKWLDSPQTLISFIKYVNDKKNDGNFEALNITSEQLTDFVNLQDWPREAWPSLEIAMQSGVFSSSVFLSIKTWTKEDKATHLRDIYSKAFPTILANDSANLQNLSNIMLSTFQNDKSHSGLLYKIIAYIGLFGPDAKAKLTESNEFILLDEVQEEFTKDLLTGKYDSPDSDSIIPMLILKIQWTNAKAIINLIQYIYDKNRDLLSNRNLITHLFNACLNLQNFPLQALQFIEDAILMYSFSSDKKINSSSWSSDDKHKFALKVYQGQYKKLLPFLSESVHKEFMTNKDYPGLLYKISLLLGIFGNDKKAALTTCSQFILSKEAQMLFTEHLLKKEYEYPLPGRSTEEFDKIFLILISKINWTSVTALTNLLKYINERKPETFVYLDLTPEKFVRLIYQNNLTTSQCQSNFEDIDKKYSNDESILGLIHKINILLGRFGPEKAKLEESSVFILSDAVQEQFTKMLLQGDFSPGGEFFAEDFISIFPSLLLKIKWTNQSAILNLAKCLSKEYPYNDFYQKFLDAIQAVFSQVTLPKEVSKQLIYVSNNLKNKAWIPVAKIKIFSKLNLNLVPQEQVIEIAKLIASYFKSLDISQQKELAKDIIKHNYALFRMIEENNRNLTDLLNNDEEIKFLYAYHSQFTRSQKDSEHPHNKALQTNERYKETTDLVKQTYETMLGAELENNYYFINSHNGSTLLFIFNNDNKENSESLTPAIGHIGGVWLQKSALQDLKIFKLKKDKEERDILEPLELADKDVEEEFPHFLKILVHHQKFDSKSYPDKILEFFQGQVESAFTPGNIENFKKHLTNTGVNWPEMPKEFSLLRNKVIASLDKVLKKLISFLTTDMSEGNFFALTLQEKVKLSGIMNYAMQNCFSSSGELSTAFVQKIKLLAGGDSKKILALAYKLGQLSSADGLGWHLGSNNQSIEVLRKLSGKMLHLFIQEYQSKNEGYFRSSQLDVIRGVANDLLTSAECAAIIVDNLKSNPRICPIIQEALG